MEYLVGNQVPFRLHYNSSETELPYMTAHSCWYVKNQAAHLMFVTIKSQVEIADLYDVFRRCCTHWNNFIAWGTIFKSFIQLILDESVLEGRWRQRCDFNIQPPVLPLNLIMFYWSGSTVLTSDATLVRETCGCDDGLQLITVADVLATINGNNGMENLQVRIRTEKADFRGR